MASEAQGAAEAVSGPRLTVFLLNQSASMARELEDYGISMAEGLADVVNLWLQKVIQKRDDDRAKGGSEFDSTNFGMVVIGYGAEGAGAYKVFEMDHTRTWADETMTKSQSATASSDAALSTFSVWINTVAGSDEATLSTAIETAAAYVEEWVRSHQLAPAPYVISLTDGTFTGGDPLEAAERLKRLGTLNGRAVLWTCQLTTERGREPALFPTEEAALSAVPSALFRATSEFPSECIPNLMMEFPETSKISGAKAGVFDADLRTLVRFVSFVTRVPLP